MEFIEFIKLLLNIKSPSSLPNLCDVDVGKIVEGIEGDYKMTYGEIYKEFCEKVNTKVQVEDYRPCIEMFGVPNIPFAILVWLEDKTKIIYISEKAKGERNVMDRQKYIGQDKGGEYTYYSIKEYDECCDCPCFYDNDYEERFECTTANCIKEK